MLKPNKEQVLRYLIQIKQLIAFNSEWMGKLTSYDMIKLASCMTVARMLERDDFLKGMLLASLLVFMSFYIPLFKGMIL